MPTTDSNYSAAAESRGGVHGRTSSLTNLARLPGMAREKLTHLAQNQFVRFIDDGQDKDENDIYRQNRADQTFTFERWSRHRSSMRYAKHLLHMFTSRVFKSLLGPVLAVMGISLFVGIYETLVNKGGLPGHWPHVTLALGQGFNLTAFALSLLLVFRTNSSYDRWWEARKLWGGVVNRTRDVVRQSLVFFREEDVHLRELLAKWTMAFPKVLMCHLRENMDVQKEVAHILTAQEIVVLCAAAHRPNFVLQVMSETIRAARPHELCRMRMDDNMTFFEDAMGSMERILRTPIPLSYSRHTSRFLLVWLIMLPFTLWAAYSWFSILLSGIFAFLMFGIDEIGVQIEEPFGVLPLEAIGATIERNIRELLSRNFEVAAVVHRQNLPVGIPTTAATAAVAAMAEIDEFGEMTGATTASDGGKTPSGVAMAAAGTGNLISLTATSIDAGVTGLQPAPAVAAAPRRVQFPGATVIDVAHSMDGSGHVGAASSATAATSPTTSAAVALLRQASHREVELASGAVPVRSSAKGAGGASSYTDWLHD